MKILAAQIDVPAVATAETRQAHLMRIDALLRSALSENAVDLVVLPELSSIDYARAAFDRLDVLAETLDGPSYEVFGGIARDHGVTIAYGIPRADGGRYFITQVVVGPDGEPMGHFDKLHIAQYGASMEKEYFEPGQHLFVFDVAGIMVAPIICYDIRFPELTRRLCVDLGVQLVLHCGAYYADESYYSWHHFVVSRALENQVYVLSLNRAGDNYGSSVFCEPWVDQTGPEVVFPKHETVRVFEVDRARIGDVRRTYSFLADRHDSYASLAVMDGTEPRPADAPARPLAATIK